jgi:cyclopropane fatty-acyl-phospholipid synthase-like methyltransferase
MSETLVILRSNDVVQKEVSFYNSLFEDPTAVDKRKDQYQNLVINYYSVSTDFFEYGWGQSFHFANRYHGETLAESIQRHESYLALKSQMKPGDRVLDLGCGVGGPLRRIAHLSGAHVTGITISQYQIHRAKTIGKNLTFSSRRNLNLLFRCTRELSIHSS